MEEKILEVVLDIQATQIEMKKEQQEMKKEQQEMKKEQREMKKQYQGIKNQQEGMMAKIEKLEELRRIDSINIAKILEVQTQQFRLIG